MGDHVPVWQTWTMLHPPLARPRLPEAGGAGGGIVCGPSFRARVQKMRVNKRLSVHDLSATVRCDPAQLAAFERGETILPQEANSRLLRLVDAWEA
jgi:hypothetical protein